jgi:hypothetical protein
MIGVSAGLSMSELTQLPPQDHSRSEDDSAVRAFGELQLDVLGIRKDIEDLARHAPPDYSATLGEIKKAIGTVSQRLSKMEQHHAREVNPALQQELSAERARLVMREPILQFDRARRAAEQTKQELGALVGAVRLRAQQRLTLFITAAAALIVGLVLSPLLARLLPFGLDTRVAAVVMGSDRWHAGAGLLAASSPEAWDALERAIPLWQSNQNVIEACQKAALKKHREQLCTISISPP